ncbi:MAG: alpha/beta hydrolase [Duncaniella sp.]|nr:alpha/beta hydrolase [Duncaniella sp.]
MKLTSYILGAFAAATAILSPAALQAESRVIEIGSPVMRVYLPEASKATGRAVVALPGGGYSHLALNHEGHDWAPFFNEQGIAYAVVTYTMPKGDRSLPVSDAQNAVKLMRDSAERWHIDPAQIGIMGSSAGGHLASTVATHAPAESRPDFQILFYPVITMDKSYTHRGSHDNLLGKEAGEELENEYSNEKQVTAETPRAFLILSSDDKAVPPANSVNYYTALLSNGIPASLHIYPTGGHGWGYRNTFSYHDQVLDELRAWLKSF